MSCFSSVLDLPAALQERVADRPQRDVEHQQPDRADPQRRIADAEEAGAKARDDVEERVGVADRLERRRELVDRIESAAEAARAASRRNW